MALIVQKFGGTSVGSIERIQQVVAKVIAAKMQGHQIVVVSSAMQGETDRLISLATQMGGEGIPDPGEFDALVATGEQVAVSLLSLGFIAKGHAARSYSGWQVKIHTNPIHKKARIVHIDTHQLQEDLKQNIIPVVAGFQGMDTMGRVTTLGRGGSDTTAVALAAALKADECQIYTDVDGVYTTDPRVVPVARRLDRITFEEMLELASLGAKVLQIRAVEFAGKYNVPVRVLSTFVEGAGTLITFEDKNMEQALVSGIAFDRNQAKLTLLGLPDRPGVVSHIMATVSDHNIEVDTIVQNVPGNERTIDFTFTVQRDDYKQAYALMEGIVQRFEAGGLLGDPRIAKLSLVGVGMRSHAGVATRLFQALAAENISVQLVTTSEIKISVIIDEKYLELGVRSLHTAFGLDVHPREEAVI